MGNRQAGSTNAAIGIQSLFEVQLLRPSLPMSNKANPEDHLYLLVSLSDLIQQSQFKHHRQDYSQDRFLADMARIAASLNEVGGLLQEFGLAKY